ncbi:DNA cytosine methyltransferase, partial [Faecalibaculum rodentium]
MKAEKLDIHVRLEPFEVELLKESAKSNNQTIQDFIHESALLNLKNTAVRNKDKYSFIDLFSGIGGMRLGFEDAECQCIYSSEWNKFSRKTYLRNFGEFP